MIMSTGPLYWSKVDAAHSLIGGSFWAAHSLHAEKVIYTTSSNRLTSYHIAGNIKKTG
jgi:hypothetical protein